MTDLAGKRLGYLNASSNDSFTLAYARPINLIANWVPNGTYTYTPSDYSGNVYNITDGKKREIDFYFYVDGKQTGRPTTADYGLGNGADYVINMDNMSYDVVSQNFKKIQIKIQYNVYMVKDGYAVMRLRYKTKSGKKEVDWKTESSDLLEKNITKTFTYELDRTDVEYFRIEFDANGGGDDEYNLKKLRLWVTYTN